MIHSLSHQPAAAQQTLAFPHYGDRARLDATDGSAAPQSGRLAFAMVALYVILEYGRPQQLFPFLVPLHLPGLVTAALVFLLFATRHLRLGHTETKLFLVLLALMVAQVPMALNNYWAFVIAESMLVTFVAYLGIITFVDSFERFKALIVLWLSVHAFNAFFALYNAPSTIGLKGLGQTGVGSFLGEENDFALALNIALPFAFFMAPAARGAIARWFCLFLVALFVSSNVLTFSRAGFIGLIAVAFYCWIRSQRKVLSLVLLGSLALLVVAVAPRGYWDEMSSIEDGAADATGSERLYLWTGGLDMFAENPIAGVGQGNFAFEFRHYEEAVGSPGLNGRSRAGLVAHSVYVTLLAELGLIGTIVWLAMVVCYVRNTRAVRRAARAFTSDSRSAELEDTARRSRRNELVSLSLAAEGSLVAYLVGGVFNTVLYYPSFWLLTAFVIVLRRISANDANPARN